MAIKQSPISFRRLERKVDTLDGKVTELSDKVDTFNPNGTYAALKKLADNSGSLLALAEIAPRVIAAVERDAEWAMWWKVTRRLFNPLRPLGAFIWLIATGIGATVVGNWLSTH